MVTITLTCTHYGSVRLIRNGRASNGKQKLCCHDCGRNSRQDPNHRAYGEGFRRQVLAA